MPRTMARRRTVGPSAKQVAGVPDFASTLLVPAHFSEGILPAISEVGLFLGHTIPSAGGMVCYRPTPLPPLKGRVFLVAEFCADGETKNRSVPLFSLCWRWLSKGATAREVFTEPLAAPNIVVHRIPVSVDEIAEDLAFTVTLKVSPISGVDMLLRAAWFEVRP